MGERGKGGMRPWYFFVVDDMMCRSMRFSREEIGNLSFGPKGSAPIGWLDRYVCQCVSALRTLNILYDDLHVYVLFEGCVCVCLFVYCNCVSVCA